MSFTLQGLRQLHDTLVNNKHAITDRNIDVVVEALRSIAEMVVYGDNKSELLFDFFCEKNMMALFLEIMWVEGGCPAKVHIQILQTLSILVNCVRNDTSLYYLLSNNYINEIIMHPHDFTGDGSEGLCDQYVSFLKSLSLRLDRQTIQFFFQEETGSFPLLNRAIELLDYADPMVRIAAQSAVLNVYSVNEARARHYSLQDETMHRLFTQVVGYLDGKFHAILELCAQHAKLQTAAAHASASAAGYGAGAGAGSERGSKSAASSSDSPLPSRYSLSSAISSSFSPPSRASSSSSGSGSGSGSGSDGNFADSVSGSDHRDASLRERDRDSVSANGGVAGAGMESQPNPEAESRRLEGQLQSHLTAVEDWLYYLQDLFGLR